MEVLDKDTPHAAEWDALKLNVVDLTATGFSTEHPGNAVAAMSALTGSLALDDCLRIEKMLGAQEDREDNVNR